MTVGAARYAGTMRYPDGGGLTAAERARRERVPELVAGGTFVGLGWAAGLALPGVWLHSGAVAGALMLAGGLLYTAGTVVSLALAEPFSGGFRLPRGLPRLRLRRSGVSVHGGSAVHRLKLPVRALSLPIYPERTRPSPLAHGTRRESAELGD